MAKKQLYQISYTYSQVSEPFIVRGRASSPQNACRLAFRKLIEAGLIKKAPKTNWDFPSSFENTEVHIIKEEE